MDSAAMVVTVELQLKMPCYANQDIGENVKIKSCNEFIIGATP